MTLSPELMSLVLQRPILTGSYAQVLGAKYILDLDPDQGIVFGLGSKVAQWVDQSSRVNTVVQGTAGSQPTLVPNVLDGHAALRITGSVFLERLNSFAGLAIGDKPTIYVIMATASVTSSYTAVIFEMSATAQTLGTTLVFYHTGTTIAWSIGRGGSGQAAYVDGVTTAIPYLLTGRQTATATQLDRNNVQVASSAGTLGIPEAADDLRIGKQFNNSNGMNGDLFRMIVANPAPTNAQHRAVIKLLRAQYPSVGIAA